MKTSSDELAAPQTEGAHAPGGRSTTLRVMKFGGTSVGSAERMRQLVQLVELALAEERVAVVASALAGVTDLLLAGLREATAGRAGETVALYRSLHVSVAGQLAPDLGGKRFAELMGTLEGLAGELEERLRGIGLLRDCSPRVQAHAVTLGERASCAILLALFQARGLPVELLNPLEILPCSGDPLEATPLPVQMRQRLETFRGAHPLLLMPGFFGGDAQGQAMCLGRGGSDYSAALLAQALDARFLEIWTDVDGIFTTDPRIAPAARSLEHISFEEALELAHFGAKVLHPRTVAPARAAGIPIRICNSFNPAHPGTRVETRAQAVVSGDQSVACGITYLRDVALVSVFGPGMEGVPGVAARIFAGMARHDISVILITQGSSETALSFCVKESEADEAAEILRAAFASEIAVGHVDEIALRRGLAVVSLVGDGMRDHVGVSGRFFGALGEAGVNVAAIAQGASERSICAVVALPDGERAVRAVHRRFFERTQRLDVLLAGPGLVGRELLRILARDREALLHRGVELRLIAVANSRRLAIEAGGIQPDTALTKLAGAETPSSSEELLAAAHRRRGGPAVLIDCTSAPEIAALYPELLRGGVHVVAASKHGVSGALDLYRRLQRATALGHGRYAYSANVGGGLPIIPAIRRLQAGGDRIERFSGIASGSLSFLFGLLEDGALFSEAVDEAKRRGFTEPDPRDDLSGLDVARKVLILARECGLALEIEQVAVDGVLPTGFDTSGSVDEFVARLPQVDGWFADRVARARAAGEALRFVGGFEVSAEGGTASAGLRSIPTGHPLHGVRGGENAFSFWSANYRERPLVISGFGAGAAVTAAAVLADVIDMLDGIARGEAAA